MKKILATILTICMFTAALSFLPISTKAASTGTVGGCQYTLDGTFLIISGNGGMGYSSRWPWGKNITDVIIMEGVTSISANAFSECRDLYSVSLPKSLTRIESNAFYGCESLRMVDVPSNVSYIGTGAFSDCTSLARIVLPEKLSELSAGILDGCTSLEYIDVDEGSGHFSSEDGVLFSRDGTELIRYPVSKYSYSYFVPEGVKSIAANAFNGCSMLDYIRLPDSITHIGENAFNGTSFYEDDSNYINGILYLGDCIITVNGGTRVVTTVGITTIADGAFVGCRGITSVKLTEDITQIGENTFKNCDELSSISIPQTVKSIGEGAFDGCSSLKHVYYTGSATEAQAIKIGSNNSPLTSVEWYYNSCVEAQTHNWQIVSENSATCSSKGEEIRKCYKCNKTFTETTPALNHTYGQWKEVKVATCTAAGSRQRNCLNCGKTQTEATAPLGHDFSKSSISGYVSCTEAKNNKCTRCDFLAEGVEALISHNYGEWKETKASTCIEEGEQSRTCADCSKKQTRTISALGHLFDDGATVKEATLYSEGLIKGKCQRCSQFVTQTVPCTYENEKLGIKIEAEEGTFKKGTEISVVRVSDDSPLIPDIEGLPEKFTAYSISAKLSGKSAER